jgi:hypothetical protein
MKGLKVPLPKRGPLVVRRAEKNRRIAPRPPVDRETSYVIPDLANPTIQRPAVADSLVKSTSPVSVFSAAPLIAVTFDDRSADER